MKAIDFYNGEQFAVVSVINGEHRDALSGHAVISRVSDDYGVFERKHR